MGFLSNIRAKREVKKLVRLDNLQQQNAILDKQLNYQERVGAFMSGAWFPGMSSSVLTTGGSNTGGMESSGLTRVFDHRAMRRNARDMMYDSVYGRTVVTRMTDTIADSGLRAKFEPKADLLGRSDEEAADWGRDVSERFDLFMKSKQFSTNEQLNGYQSQWQYALAQQRDNSFYARLYYDRDKSRISPLNVQHLDPDQICGASYTSTEGSANFVNSGILYDSRGRETAYKVLTKRADGTVSEATIPKKGARSGKRYMIHAFRPEYAGQRDGYVLVAHALQRLEDLTTFSQSHLYKAIWESTVGGWTKPSKDAPASGHMEDLADNEVDVIEDLLAGSDTPEEVKDRIRKASIQVLPEMSHRQVGVAWVGNAGAGEEVLPFKGSTPAQSYPEFVDNVLMYLSASQGMSIETLQMKFGENYSASRAALVLLWRIMTMWREWMVADYLDIIAEAWLEEEIAAGRISAPGWSDPRMKAAWMNIRWVGTSMPVIDPKKESEARMNNATVGCETLDDIALAHNNSDGRKNRARLKREYEELAVPPWLSGAVAAAAAGNVGEDNPEDSECIYGL